ncbi:unnamed protein product [Rotaria sp. Silwood2]|nr:unnamed protein product [Rotaria sp. Silwood2]CAF2761034.1 unnamed protein product [Rotaria sp. Silwood2]CAF2970055.1 unnamed protein product [Rotaria sp. Silwood2]CAF3938179.1 unnamed protein product [Rotaria sp. Silwood2]CAF4026400.1 unnamed protein product [Rotaria sp. Silwood2]
MPKVDRMSKSDNELNRVQLSTYFDNNNQSILYFNNYPEPPLTDGQVQTDQENLSTNRDHIISKTIRIYLTLNGIITIIFGLISIAIQIAIVISYLISYYYFGFWGRLFLIFIGLGTTALSNHHQTDYSKLFHSLFWQSIRVVIIFSIGMLIILTDKCNGRTIENDNGNHLCRKSYRILNGFLLGIFALILLQSMINGIIFFILKRKHSFVEI